MHDSDPLLYVLVGRAVTRERIDAARGHLVMLRSLLGDVSAAVPGLVPAGGGGWRSTAADRYRERLDELRTRLFAARDMLAEAETQLVARIQLMETRLEAQEAATVQAAMVRQKPGDERGAGTWLTR